MFWPGSFEPEDTYLIESRKQGVRANKVDHRDPFCNRNDKPLPVKSVVKMKKDGNTGNQTQWNIWRWVCAFVGLFFFLAAYVQHNDPDPYFWMPAYLIPCFISWTITLTPYSSEAIFQKFRLTQPQLDCIIVIHIIYCFLLGGWTLIYYLYFKQKHSDENGSIDDQKSSQNFSEDHMPMEEGKELLGLCLVIAWMAFIKNRNFIRFGKTGIALGITLTVIPFLAWICVAVFEQKESQCRHPSKQIE